MRIPRKYLALIVLIGALGWLRSATPEWSILDYLGLLALVLTGIFVLTFCSAALIAITDMACPVRLWIADRTGFTYTGSMYDSECHRWQRREEP